MLWIQACFCSMRKFSLFPSLSLSLSLPPSISLSLSLSLYIYIYVLQVELDGAKTRLAAQHAQIQLLQTQLEEGQHVTVPSQHVTAPSHCAPFDESAPLVAQVLVGGVSS